MTSPHPFSPDQPIASTKQDKLGRAGFANSIANAIINWKSNDSSLTIALWGDWGTGKTSLKNMVLESLSSPQHQSAPIPIVDFSPWQLNNEDALTRVFFDEIAHALGKERTGVTDGDAKRSAARLRKFGTYFQLGSPIVLSALSLFSPYASQNNLDPNVIAAIAPAIGQVASAGSAILEQGAKGVEAQAAQASVTLSELKSEVSSALKTLPGPILVVIDDVDRLTKEEIRRIFQLIKACADFPNLIYMLLGRRDYILNALESLAPGHSNEFLEKLVQIELHVPHLQPHHLEDLVMAGLTDILKDQSVKDTFDEQRWTAMWSGGLSGLFTNLRQVNRYLSTLRFHTAVFKRQNVFEVNATDLFALEAIRVFMPSAYVVLRKHKQHITDYPHTLSQNASREAEDALATMSQAFPEKSPQKTLLRVIMEQLFPVFGRASVERPQDPDWYRTLRIASHKMFDLYFVFEAPSGSLSEERFQKIINDINQLQRAGHILQALNRTGDLDIFLEKLLSKKPLPGIANRTNFISALVKVGADQDSAQPMIPARRPLVRDVVGKYIATLSENELLQSIDTVFSSTLTTLTKLEIWHYASPKPDNDLISEQDLIREQINMKLCQFLASAAATDELVDYQALFDLPLVVWLYRDRVNAAAWLHEKIRWNIYSIKRFFSYLVKPEYSDHLVYTEVLHPLDDVISIDQVTEKFNELPRIEQHKYRHHFDYFIELASRKQGAHLKNSGATDGGREAM